VWAAPACLLHEGMLKRCDALFEIHQEKEWNDEKQVSLFNKWNCPVYMHEHYDEIPKSVPFPREALQGFFPREYYQNTISYMLAYAIYLQDYERIELYGVHFATDHESFNELPSFEYYCGFAEARGIELVIPDGSDVLKLKRQYGYEKDMPEVKDIEQRRGLAKKASADTEAHLKKLQMDFAGKKGMSMAFNIVAKQLEEKRADVVRKDLKAAIEKADADIMAVRKEMDQATATANFLRGNTIAFELVLNTMAKRGFADREIILNGASR